MTSDKYRPLSNFSSKNRCLSTSHVHNSADDKDRAGWFSNLFVRKIETGKDSHSRLLSDPEAVYEMQIHDVKPESMDNYLKGLSSFVSEVQSKDPNYELVASFQVDIGDQDQIVNIWRYKKGWPSASLTKKLLKTDTDLIKLNNDQAKLVRQRQSQMMMAFSFWGHPQPMIRDCNYEMRSYVLKVSKQMRI